MTIPDTKTILLASIMVQGSCTMTLLMLGLADRHMRGMRWLALTSLLSVIAMIILRHSPQEVIISTDLPVAITYSLSALCAFLGLRCFASEPSTPQPYRWPIASFVIISACIIAGRALPFPATVVVRLNTMVILLATVRMLWTTPIPALRPTLRLAGILLAATLLIPASMVFLNFHGLDFYRNSAFSRIAVAVVVTLMDFVFVLAYVAENKRRLHHGTRRDGLTGLCNRLAFDEALAAEIRNASTRRPLALLMLDIDRFKALNDTWGHLLGDDALRAISRVLQSVVEGSILAARLGGEEFALLLPAHHPAAAIEVAQRVRIAIEEIHLPHPSGTVRITTSIGVSAWHPGDSDSLPMLSRADEALYAAKDSGRNRVHALHNAAPVQTPHDPALTHWKTGTLENC